MISLVDLGWVKKNAPNIELKSISEFMKEEVGFKAANNTDVTMVGILIMEFTLGIHSFLYHFL